MKFTTTWLLTFVCLATLFISCSKEPGFKTPAITPAVEQNMAQIHTTLQTTDFSAEKPGDWWWNDETVTASSTARQVGGITVPMNIENLMSFRYLDAALA